jgi:hypothetical protein
MFAVFSHAQRQRAVNSAKITEIMRFIASSMKNGTTIYAEFFENIKVLLVFYTLLDNNWHLWYNNIRKRKGDDFR